MLRTVTPEQARAWLSTSTQGYVEVGRIQRFAAEMRSFRWDDREGDPVKVNDSCLVTGNHRLFAILLADSTVTVEVEEV